MRPSRARSSALYLPMILLGAPITAQIAVEVRTVTPATASTANGAQTIPANTVLTDGQEVRATFSNTCGTATAGARVNFQSAAASADVQLNSDASVRTGFLCIPSPGAAWTEANAFRVSFTSPTPTFGHVVVSMSGSGSTGLNYANATCTVDFGEDGSIELNGNTDTAPNAALAGFVERPVVLGPTPLRIVLTSQVFSANPYQVATGGSAQLTVAFRAGSGRLGFAGQPCGASLLGTLVRDDNGHHLDLHADTPRTAPLSFLVLGTQSIAFALPPSPCILRTDPSTVIPISMGTNGWSTTVILPTPLEVFDLRVQALAAALMGSTVQWHASEGLVLQLR